MSATQEDYAYVYNKSMPNLTNSAAHIINIINTILTSVNPHFWQVDSHVLNNSIVIKNISNGNDRWIRLVRTGDTVIEIKFSDVGPPVDDPLVDGNWPVGSSDTRNLMRPAGYTTAGLNKNIIVVEYVDAFGIIIDGGIYSNGGWRWGAVIGKVINTLNKSDAQHWNGNAEVVGLPAAGTSKGGFNGEGIINGAVGLVDGATNTWLQGDSDWSFVRTDVNTWTVIDTDYNYTIGAVDYNNAGRFAPNVPLHLKINNAERLIPYPVMDKANNMLLGFTRYHRSFEFMTSHGTLIKSTDPLSKQAWFMYRGNGASAWPLKNNTCILWNKDESVTVP